MGRIEPFIPKEPVFLFAPMLCNGEKTVEAFVGPLLQEEVEEVVFEEFGEEEKVEIIGETYFKALYKEIYETDFRFNWPSYIETFLKHRELTVLVVENGIEVFDLEVDSTLLLVRNLCLISVNNNRLLVNFFLDTKPNVASALVLALHQYCRNIMEIQVGENTYVDLDSGKLFYGEKALEQQKTDSLLRSVFSN